MVAFNALRTAFDLAGLTLLLVLLLRAEPAVLLEQAGVGAVAAYEREGSDASKRGD